MEKISKTPKTEIPPTPQEPKIPAPINTMQEAIEANLPVASELKRDFAEEGLNDEEIKEALERQDYLDNYIQEEEDLRKMSETLEVPPKEIEEHVKKYNFTEGDAPLQSVIEKLEALITKEAELKKAIKAEEKDKEKKAPKETTPETTQYHTLNINYIKKLPDGIQKLLDNEPKTLVDYQAYLDEIYQNKDKIEKLFDVYSKPINFTSKKYGNYPTFLFKNWQRQQQQKRTKNKYEDTSKENVEIKDSEAFLAEKTAKQNNKFMAAKHGLSVDKFNELNKELDRLHKKIASSEGTEEDRDLFSKKMEERDLRREANELKMSFEELKKHREVEKSIDDAEKINFLKVTEAQKKEQERYNKTTNEDIKIEKQQKEVTKKETDAPKEDDSEKITTNKEKNFGYYFGEEWKSFGDEYKNFKNRRYKNLKNISKLFQQDERPFYEKDAGSTVGEYIAGTKFFKGLKFLAIATLIPILGTILGAAFIGYLSYKFLKFAAGGGKKSGGGKK